MGGCEAVLLLVLVRLEHHVHLVAGGGDGEGNLIPAEATQDRTGLRFAIVNCHVVVGAFLLEIQCKLQDFKLTSRNYSEKYSKKMSFQGRNL